MQTTDVGRGGLNRVGNPTDVTQFEFVNLEDEVSELGRRSEPRYGTVMWRGRNSGRDEDLDTISVGSLAICRLHIIVAGRVR